MITHLKKLSFIQSLLCILIFCMHCTVAPSHRDEIDSDDDSNYGEITEYGFELDECTKEKKNTYHELYESESEFESESESEEELPSKSQLTTYKEPLQYPQDIKALEQATQELKQYYKNIATYAEKTKAHHPQLSVFIIDALSPLQKLAESVELAACLHADDPMYNYGLWHETQELIEKHDEYTWICMWFEQEQRHPQPKPQKPLFVPLKNHRVSFVQKKRNDVQSHKSTK